MLAREAMENRNLRDRLLLEAEQSNPTGLDITAYRRSIASATQTDGFVDYHSAYDYTRRILQVTDSIAALLNRGHAPAVVELTEYALAQLETAIGEMDDSDGYMNDILPRAPESTSSRLPGRSSRTLRSCATIVRMGDDERLVDFLWTAETYADVFGAEGLAEYRRLAESEWAKIRPLNPGDKEDVRSTRRFRITRMMEALARQLDDTDSLVEIKRRDLSDAYSFLEIAEIYREAGQHDKALDWPNRESSLFREPIRDWLSFSPSNITAALDTTTQ